MNFLGVGPGELILILIITLVVVGPERLPGLARQVGRALVRVRNWMQTSPDAALVLRARQELEQELAQLRSSLLEVQNVRDEVLDVAKQIDEAVSPIASIRPPSIAELIKEPADKPQPRAEAGQSGAEVPPAADEAQLVGADGQPLALDEPPGAQATADAARESGLNGVPSLDGAPQAPAAAGAVANGAPPAAPAPSAQVSAELDMRLQALMADLNALQEQLKRRGLLDDDWQPPSWAMQLPAQPVELPIEEADR